MGERKIERQNGMERSRIKTEREMFQVHREEVRKQNKGKKIHMNITCAWFIMIDF